MPTYELHCTPKHRFFLYIRKPSKSATHSTRTSETAMATDQKQNQLQSCSRHIQSSTNWLPGVLDIISCRVCAYTTATFVMTRPAFSQAAPRVWNDLPIEKCNSATFDRFRSALRTHHYRRAFDNNCTS